MRRSGNLVGLAVFGTLAFNAAPAAAQVEANSQEVYAYGGELFGDDLTDTEISGLTPKLDDDLTSASAMGTTSRVRGASSCLWDKARAP